MGYVFRSFQTIFETAVEHSKNYREKIFHDRVPLMYVEICRIKDGRVSPL
jgi:hypothetical protein